ncbi:hypothetical protein [Cognatiluteimonas telluris]|uniref:hypothetical protein n=1 Tax=Cognatiluteimonas telluris TaxID=1104775 RepID=UPI00140891E1|nr:hypothetical protein [Lysobacter telluris]
MQIRFTKGRGKYDEMLVARDGVTEAIACPKQRIIPHDMVHFAVESTLQRRGFLFRIRDGELANFQMTGEVESDGVERLVEAVQGDAWSGGNSASQDVLDLYRITCSARECPPLPAGIEEIDAIRLKIEELDAKWQALEVGESMDLQV